MIGRSIASHPTTHTHTHTHPHPHTHTHTQTQKQTQTHTHTHTPPHTHTETDTDTDTDTRIPQRRRRIKRRRQRRRGARANRVRQLDNVAAVKGRRECAQLVQYDTERPDVGGKCVGFLFAHFGREVQWRAVECVDELLLVVNLAADLKKDNDETGTRAQTQ